MTQAMWFMMTLTIVRTIRCFAMMSNIVESRYSETFCWRILTLLFAEVLDQLKILARLVQVWSCLLVQPICC